MTPKTEAHGMPARWYGITLGVLFEGGLVGVAWLLGWLLEQPALASFRWDAHAAGLGAAACAPLLLLLPLLDRLRVPAVERVRRFCDEVVRPLFGSCTLAELALLSLLAGVGEEMLFREVLQGAFGRWLGPEGGLIAASVLFGLMHPITPLYVVMATVFGAYLGACWLATGNLLVAIVAHALYDFIALVYLLRVR